jgi:hypothetical protein
MKANRVSGLQQRRLRAPHIERLEGRAADDVPAAGGHIRVDAGLAAGDRHRSGGHGGARFRAARGGNARIDLRHVGEPRDEADHVDAVDHRRVPRHDLVRRAAGPVGDLLEVRAELAAVKHRHLHDVAAGYHAVRCAFGNSSQLRLEPLGIDAQWVEVHRDRAVSDHHVPHGHAEPALRLGREGDAPGVDGRIDHLGPGHEQRRVAGR